MERFFSLFMRNWGKLGALLELGRPWNGMVTGLFALLGVYIAGGSVSFLSGVIIFTIFTFAYMGGATLNDIYDEQIDKINMPYRPLEESRISKNASWVYSAILHVASLSIAALISLDMIFFVGLFLVFSFFYSMPPIFLSRRGIVAQLDLSLVAFLIPSYAGIVYATGSYTLSRNLVFFMLSMFSLFVFIFFLKDFKDVKGDQRWGKLTPVVRYGRENVRKGLIAGTVMSYIFTIYNFSRLSDIRMLSLLLFAVLFAALIITESRIIKDPERYFGIGRIILLFVVLTMFSNLI